MGKRGLPFGLPRSYLSLHPAWLFGISEDSIVPKNNIQNCSINGLALGYACNAELRVKFRHAHNKS